MNLAWAGGQVVGGAAGGGLADLTADAVPYAILAVVCAATLLRIQPQLGHGAVPRAR
jgi:hypothetical protein